MSANARKTRIVRDDAEAMASAKAAVAAAPPSVTYGDISHRVAEMPKGAQRKLYGSTLASWMTVFGKTDDDDASDLSLDRLDERLARYECHASIAALSSGTRNNRRTGVRSLSSMHAKLMPAEPIQLEATANPYWEKFNAAMATAKLSSCQRRNLLRSGASRRMPQSAQEVRRKAAEIGADPDCLLPHVWLWESTMLFDLKNPEYRWNEQHHVLTEMPYLLECLPSQVEERVAPFMLWRRASSPQELKVELLDGSVYTLQRNGGWTRRPNQETWEWAPTERLYREFLRGFFGFLNLKSDHDDPKMRGLGIPLADLKVAHLLVGANVTAYCDFQKVRNGSFDHTGLEKLRQDWCLLVGSLESYGRHAQAANREDLECIIGKDAMPSTPVEWIDWCSDQLKIIDIWIGIETEGRRGKNKYKQARCAEENLDVLFARRRPMEEVVWPTIYWLAENRPPPYYSAYDRYLHESKIFTLSSLAAEPLRVENWQEMLWGKNLFKREGKWTVNVAVAYLKNRRVLTRPYKSTIEDAAQEFIESWYRIWKQMFGYDPLDKTNWDKTSHVHAGYARNPADKPSHEIVRGRLFFLQEAWGITVGPQAFRHIWATDWLKRHPEDYGTVAGKLNDTVGTIIAQYGHIKSEDHSARANEANAGVPQRAMENLKAQLVRRKVRKR